MNGHDRDTLRALANRVCDIAASEEHTSRRHRWEAHNSLEAGRPMLLFVPAGGWSEHVPDSDLTCREKPSRLIERDLRGRIHQHEHIPDDCTIEAAWKVERALAVTGWGLDEGCRDPNESGVGRRTGPLLTSVEDAANLGVPDVQVDRLETERRIDQVERLFGDLLLVRPVGVQRITYRLMHQYMGLRGSTQALVDMFRNPELIHEAMRRLVAGHKSLLRQYEELGLLSLNNDGTFHGCGGMGHTREIPGSDPFPDRVVARHLWASAESRELAAIGPELRREFALRYERELLQPFGLTGYGCHEPISDLLDDVCSIDRMRRVSVATMDNAELVAEALGPRYIFSWDPTPLMTGDLSDDAIRESIRDTIAAARRHGCLLEIVYHGAAASEEDPTRLGRWCRIARSEVDRAFS